MITSLDAIGRITGMIGIYVRVSTEEQAKKGYSVENQIDECKKKAQTNDVMEYIDKGYSGEFLERPGLDKLRKDVKDGIIEKVVCYDPDRLSRKLMNALIIDDEFRKKGVEMIYVSGEFAKTPEGQLFYSMRGAISEFEKAKINERMSGGRKRKAREGKVVKNNYVYGYDYDKEKGAMVINEEEAKVVKLIFDLFTQTNSIVRGINGIAKHLTEKGIPTKRGAAVWHRQVVRQILINHTYKGEFYQNRWNTEGMLANRYKTDDDKVSMKERDKSEWILTKVPAIVTEEQFNYAQELISQSRRRWAKSGKRQYLLSGLLRCGKCGNTLTGLNKKNWGKYVLTYSDRKNYSGAKHIGCGVEVPCEKLDEAVWLEVKKLLDDPERIESHNQNEQQPVFELEQMAILENEIEKARKGRKKLMQLFALGDDIDTDEIRESIIEMKEKEDSYRKQLEELQQSVQEAQSQGFNTEALKRAVEHYVKGDVNSFEDQQNLIRTIVKEVIVYDKDNINIRLF